MANPNQLVMIVVFALGLGLFGSLLSLPSCHWLRVRGREDRNHNVGIWQRSARSDEDTKGLFGFCIPYAAEANIDAELKLARASTILAPIFAGLALFGCYLYYATPSKPQGLQLMVLGSFLAFFFQLLTLTVDVAEIDACNFAEGNTWCAVGLSTWAFWVSMAAAAVFLAATLCSCGMLFGEQKGQDEAPPPASPEAPATDPSTIHA